MTWGQPFRDAWRRSTESGQAAAREAALSPEQAAGLLSQETLHRLKLLQFAAQDLERINPAKTAIDAKSSKSASTAVRCAMDDIRHGRISPDQSEQHLRQAARVAVIEAAAMQGPMTNDDIAIHQEIQLATSRFNALRRKLVAEMDETQQRRITTSSIAARNARGDPNILKPNLEWTARLIAAHASIDQIFLSNKAVDNPAAPLPSAVDGNEQRAALPCQPPPV